MANVKLTWAEANTNEAGHRVYRSTATINTASPPAPLADIGPNVTEYTDTTAAATTTYYYRVSAYDSNEEKFSAEITVAVP